MAKAAGFPHTFDFNDLPTLERELPRILKLDGPVFINVKATPSGKKLSTKMVPVLAEVRALREALTQARR